MPKSKRRLPQWILCPSAAGAIFAKISRQVLSFGFQTIFRQILSFGSLLISGFVIVSPLVFARCDPDRFLEDKGEILRAVKASGRRDRLNRISVCGEEIFCPGDSFLINVFRELHAGNLLEQPGNISFIIIDD